MLRRYLLAGHVFPASGRLLRIGSEQNITKSDQPVNEMILWQLGLSGLRRYRCQLGASIMRQGW